MAAILTRALFFFLLIVLAYVLKKAGFLKSDDSKALGKLILYITLPSAVISGFSSFSFTALLLLIPLISFAANIALEAIGYILAKGKRDSEKIFYLLNTPTYNIGNFTLPFSSGFLGPEGVIGTCLFDMGASFLTLSGCYAFTSAVLKREGERSLLKDALKIFTKPAFDAYIIMIILSLLGLKMPSFIIDFASFISPANGVLAMLMIGLMLDFRLKKSDLFPVFKVIFIRLVFASVLALLVYNFLPLAIEMKRAVVITFFSPISSSSAAFVTEFNGNNEQAGFAGSLSIIISLSIYVTLFMLWL